MIIDVQSVKNADTTGLKDYDAGKMVSGIKRHIAVDTQGLPHAVAVTTVTDRKGALQALKHGRHSLVRVHSVLCDSGYVGQPFAQGVQEILGEHVTVQIAKRSEMQFRESQSYLGNAGRFIRSMAARSHKHRTTFFP